MKRYNITQSLQQVKTVSERKVRDNFYLLRDAMGARDDFFLVGDEVGARDDFFHQSLSSLG